MRTQPPVILPGSFGCVGLVCHIGTITGQGCASYHRCPLEVLAERGVINFPGIPSESGGGQGGTAREAPIASSSGDACSPKAGQS